ncbi:hypothetical protein D3C81_190710 [compost metagenome]
MQIANVGSIEHHNLSLLQALLWPDQELTKTSVGSLGVRIGYFFRSVPKGEEAWVRFQNIPAVEVTDEQKTHSSPTYTYLLNRHWTKVLLGGNVVNSLSEQILADLSRAPIEYPSSWLVPAPAHPQDSMTQNDFRRIADYIPLLRDSIAKRVKEITDKANRFVEASRCRDHDLHLTFKMIGEHFTEFAVRFDKVAPLVPKGGVFLGEGPKCEIDIHPDDQLTHKVFNRILVLEKSVNRDIRRFERMGEFTEAGLKAFRQEVKTLLYAASHFSKRLYPFDGTHGRPILEKVADDILRKLHAVGGNIGLDISSWICWQYYDDVNIPPTIRNDEGLDFKEDVLNSYTESFINHLTGVLMDVQSPYVRPYSYVVKADPNDGYAIGSIRRTA